MTPQPKKYIFTVFSAPDAKRMYTVWAETMERDGSYVAFRDGADACVGCISLQPGWFVRRDEGTPNSATDPKGK